MNRIKLNILSPWALSYLLHVCYVLALLIYTENVVAKGSDE